MLTPDEVREIANRVLGETLGPAGFVSADVTAGEDHDGDAAVFLTAHFKPASGVTPGQRSLAARGALREALLQAGDDRLVYIRYAYPDSVPSLPDADEAA